MIQVFIKEEVLKVTRNENGSYSVQCGEGTNPAEVAFAISCVIRVFAKNNIEPQDVFTARIISYANDPQYNESQANESGEQTKN